jgi:hypothetical protein
MKIRILLILTLLGTFSGCSRDIPLIAKNEGFSSISEITKDEYVKKLTEYKLESGKSKEIEISIIDKFIFPKSNYPVVIKKKGDWREVVITDQLSSYVEGRINKFNEPIYLYYKDMRSGETFPDSVICYKDECIDVTATYLFAEFEHSSGMVLFPESFFGVTPQDIANIGRLGNLDPEFISYMINSADEEIRISEFNDGKTFEYTEKDRVFILGSKDSKIGRDTCLGYVNHKGEFDTDKGFYYICYNEKYKIFTSTNKKIKINSIKDSEITSFDISITDDLYWRIPNEIKEYALLTKIITEDYDRLHKKI